MGAPTAQEFFFSQPPLDGDAREARERAFFESIRLKNGTYKATYSHRLDAVNDVVNKLLPVQRPLEIMDVAVSSGVGTLEWMESLDGAGIEYRMTAGDLYVKAFLFSFTRALNILTDNSGYPLQFDILGRAFPYPLGRRRAIRFPPLFALVQALRWALPVLFAVLFKRRAVDAGATAVRRFGIDCRRVLLVSPRLTHERSLRILDDDILSRGAFTNRFHVVRAANILNKDYFSDETLRTMAFNLRGRLKPEGILIVCKTDYDGVNHGTVFRLNAAGRLDVVRRIGGGSEIETLVLDLPGTRGRESPDGADERLDHAAAGPATGQRPSCSQ